MNVVVSLEHRFERTPDGAVWTQTAFAYDFFWAHYLAAFDNVRVVARIHDVPTISADYKRADGDRVTFAAVPYYVGPQQYLSKFHQVRSVARSVVEPLDAVILRVPSHIANCVEPMLRKKGHPYAVQVVGNPYDVFAPGSVGHFMRPFFRWWFTGQLQKQCRNALAASYVTKQNLQQHYPCPKHSVHFSDVKIPQATLVLTPRPTRGDVHTFTFITVGSLAQLYKGVDVLIDAVAVCVAEGLDLKLIVVGDGKHRAALETQTVTLRLGERVFFRGQLSAGDAVRAQLDQADLFVLPSRTEGLPRAMIEAMARALPCIGSTAGGIPELLPSEDMVPPGDVTALARKLREVVSDPERMARMSARNLEKAKEYREETLQEQRITFYRYVREMTEAWLHAKERS